jgi:uncharacterized membrane protein YqjE
MSRLTTLDDDQFTYLQQNSALFRWHFPCVELVTWGLPENHQPEADSHAGILSSLRHAARASKRPRIQVSPPSSTGEPSSCAARPHLQAQTRCSALGTRAIALRAIERFETTMPANPVRPDPTTASGRDGQNHLGTVVTRLGRLLELEVELGVAEIRGLVTSLAVAAGVAVAGVIILLSSLVVLVAGAIAPVFGARWQHLVVSGGVFFVLAGAAVAWSIWRLKHISWPAQTLRSLEETRRWLGAQLRSKLTLR